jgi:hypothetical protein
MIFYIGDISKQDAQVLARHATIANSVLEFGCGASTQILRHYCKGIVTSVETMPIWIDRTKQNLDLLGITKPVEFYIYGNDPNDETVVYDFIFSDGLPELRLDFALKHWDRLRVGGVMAFHDTRRDHDFWLALQLMLAHHEEIEAAQFNVWSSNITCIRKRPPLPYENWNTVEGRNKPWQYGHSDVDMDEFAVMKKAHDEDTTI